MSEELDAIHEQLTMLTEFVGKLNARIDSITDFTGTLADQNEGVRKLWVYDEADSRTHLCILRQVCAELGVPQESLLLHYKAVCDHYISEVLEEAEDVSAAVGALLDVRSQARVDAYEPPVPLFPGSP